MKQSTVKGFSKARLGLVCFFAISILFLVSSSKPWAAEILKPIRSASSEVRNPNPTVAGSYRRDTLIGPATSAITFPTATNVFTKNQTLLANHSPVNILPTDDTGTSFTGTIPVGSPVHIVYGISVPTGDPNPVSLTITLPASFSPTLLRGVKFSGGTGSGTPLPPTVTSLPTFSIGALNGNFDKVIVVIDGFFTQAGSVFATFDATRSATTESSSLTMSADVLNLPVDISITKTVRPKSGGTWGPTATVSFNNAVTYKLTVKNESAPDPNHSTDLYLGPLLKLQDTLSTPGNDVNLSITLSNFQCTPSSLADCLAVPTTSISMLLGANGSQTQTFAYPAASSGFLPAQGSFEITFDVAISTGALCSPGQNNKLLNRASLTYSNGTKTVSDQVPSNNSTLPLSPTTVTLTGLPPTGCVTNTTPGITVEKKLVSPATGAWGTPFTYLITITNTSGQTLTGLKLWDYVTGNSTPPFTATISPTASNFICSPACGALPAAAAPLVVPNSQYLFQNLALASPMAAGAVQTVQFDVQYDRPCAQTNTPGSIKNTAFLSGPATGSGAVVTGMPSLPLCQLATTKVQTSGPTSFASFPVTLGYKVEFNNNSNQVIKVGTLIDAMALDSAAYGDVPIDYSYTCTATGVTNIAPLTKPVTSALIKNNNPLWAGVRLIDFSSSAGAVFSPAGKVSCDVSVTLKQPPKNDSLCQGAGAPKIMNSAFMDLAYGFNTNQTQVPVYYQSVASPLPHCVSIIVGKTVAPNVFAGGAVTFTLTVKNVGNDPISNIILNDNVPPDFTGVMWTCASGCSSSGSTTPSNTISIPLNTIAAGATVTVMVTATAPTILGSYCNPANATFNPFPSLSFFEGDQNALTKASACVQVKSPEPSTPVLTKSFAPAQIGPNGTSTLGFTITNGSGDPKQTGISFSDTLPAGLQIVSVIANGCGGNVGISGDGKSVTLTNGQLVGANTDGSGQHSCQINVNVKATGVCGVYRNNKDNFSQVTNIDVSGINQQLEVVDCRPPTESCEVKTNEISCKADGTGGYLYSFTVTNNTGQLVTDILLTPPANSNITLSQQQFSLLPAGLAAGASITLQVTIKGGKPEEPACFYVTLMTQEGECCTTRVCPVLPECCAVAKEESIECNSDGTFTYTMSVVNTGVDTIEHIYLYPPGGVTMTPNYFHVSLKPGNTFTTKVTIKGAKRGDKLCFDISLHTANMEKCCQGQQCIVLPACPVSGSGRP
jgi:uncharacterized repeat protein (TIGR01451 family)